MNPVYRLFFVVAYLPFAAGVCIMVWKRYDINYIHIMQIELHNRMSPYQLWKIAAIIAFTVTTISFIVAIRVFALTLNDNKKEKRKDLEDFFQNLGIVSVTFLIALWLNPFHFFYRRVRYSTIGSLL